VNRHPGDPSRVVERLIVRMARENRDWGYDRIAGALANLGYKVCDQTVGNVLQRHGLPPAPERKRTTTWSAFIRIHLALLAGTDFFTAEVLTLHGLVTYYVLFFIHLESRRQAHHCQQKNNRRKCCDLRHARRDWLRSGTWPPRSGWERDSRNGLRP
jgi:hypothetical protein